MGFPPQVLDRSDRHHFSAVVRPIQAPWKDSGRRRGSDEAPVVHGVRLGQSAEQNYACAVHTETRKFGELGVKGRWTPDSRTGFDLETRYGISSAIRRNRGGI